MSEQNELGNPKYAVDQAVAFDAIGPEHRKGTGWLGAIRPIKVASGAIEPVYCVRIWQLEGEPVPASWEEAGERVLLLGELEITRVFPDGATSPSAPDDVSPIAPEA
jgi:hypothetical protein